MTGRRHMWTTAKVHELTLRINGNRLSIRKAFDQLHLVMLPTSFKELHCLLLREVAAGDGKLAFRDFARALLDVLEIFRRERPIVGKVIIKTVFQSRPDRQLSGGKKFFHGLRHDVCAAMPVDFPAFGSVESKWIDGRICGQRRRQIGRPPVDRGGQHLGPDRNSASGQGLGNSITRRDVKTLPILQGDFRHIPLSMARRRRPPSLENPVERRNLTRRQTSCFSAGYKNTKGTPTAAGGQMPSARW